MDLKKKNRHGRKRNEESRITSGRQNMPCMDKIENKSPNKLKRE